MTETLDPCPSTNKNAVSFLKNDSSVLLARWSSYSSYSRSRFKLCYPGELQPPSTPSRTGGLAKHKFGMNWTNNRVGCRRCTCGQKIIQPISIQGYSDRTKGTGKKKVAKVKIDQISRTRDPPVLTHSVTPTLYVITPVTRLLHPVARLLHAHDLIHIRSELSHGLRTC